MNTQYSAGNWYSCLYSGYNAIPAYHQVWQRCTQCEKLLISMFLINCQLYRITVTSYIIMNVYIFVIVIYIRQHALVSNWLLYVTRMYNYKNENVFLTNWSTQLRSLSISITTFVKICIDITIRLISDIFCILTKIV